MVWLKRYLDVIWEVKIKTSITLICVNCHRKGDADLFPSVSLYHSVLEIVRADMLWVLQDYIDCNPVVYINYGLKWLPCLCDKRCSIDRNCRGPFAVAIECIA